MRFIKKLIIRISLIFLIVFGVFSFLSTSSVEAIGEVQVMSPAELQALESFHMSEETNWIEDAYMWFDKWKEDNWAAVAWKSALGQFLNRMAYDTATYLATGDKGQAPMFQTDSIGDFVQNAADYAVGDALEALGRSGKISEAFGVDGKIMFNVCTPSLDVKMKIGMGIQRYYRPKDPTCTFTEMKEKWDEELARPDFLNRFSNMFDPKQNDLGIALTLRTGIEDIAQKKANDKIKEYEINDGWKPVNTLISDKVSAPASVNQARFEKALDDSTSVEKSFTGNILADAIGVFANTLIGKLAGQWFGKGLVSKFPDNSYQGDWGGFDSYNSTSGGSGVAGAKERFRNLIEPNFSVRGDYDILGELTVCPKPTQAGPTNCVITESFSQAVAGNMTVGEAMRGGYLNEDGTFGFLSNDLEPSYMEGYPYRSLIILRKFRIIPVGWELAAEYIKNNQNDVSGTISLKDLVNCFSGDDEYGEIDNDPNVWCRDMVDPNWVLKAPLNYCKKEGPGPEILNSQVTGKGLDSKVVLTRNDNYCADEQSCIKENNDGSCDFYGYCTEERRKWDFNQSSCEPLYNTCMNFRSREGGTISYLEDTIDYGVCDIDNVGCQSLCNDYDYDMDEFSCTDVPNGDRIYLDKDKKECAQEQEGCHEFIRTKPGLGANFLPNSSFEEIAIGNAVEDGVDDDFGWWDNNFGLDADAVAPGYDGQIAVNLLSDFSADVAVENNPEIAQENYTLSFYAKSCNDGDLFRITNTTSGNDYTASSTLNSTNEWRFHSLSIVVPSNSNSEILTIEIPEPCIIDAIKLERGSSPTRYSKYRQDGLIYQKLAPAGLDCSGLNPPAECDNFVRECSSLEVGCNLYTSLNDGISVPAKTKTSDYCPAQCVGYDDYMQTESDFDSSNLHYFIPEKEKSCSAASAGCDEFTNLDKIGENAEAREYYSSLKQCIKPNGDCSEFYTWEGSSETGYQLKVHSFERDVDDINGNLNTSEPAVTEDDSVLCSEEIFNLPLSDPRHNSDCREFYDTSGNISYHLFGRTIMCSENCHPYRKTENNVMKDLNGAVITDVAICRTYSQFKNVGPNQYQDINNVDGDPCIYCKNNGVWNPQHGACIYNAIPGDGVTCSAASAGCREYTGSSGNNTRVILNSDFEGSTQGWVPLGASGAKNDSGALIVGGEALLVYDDEYTAGVNIFGLAGENKSYYLTFIAKNYVSPIGPDPASEFDIISMGSSTVASTSFVQDTETQINGNNGWQLDGNWRIYKFNLANLNHEVMPGDKLIISADGDFLIDDVRLTEISNRYYLIKENPWNIPESCYYDITGNYVGYKENLGCSQYRDKEGEIHYLHYFSDLCFDSAVGCELMIDTHNYSSYDSAIWNDEDNSGICEVGEEDCVSVPADNFAYIVYDSDKRCFLSDKGCGMLGSPNKYGVNVFYDKIYVKNDPDAYDEILCQENAVDCEEWAGDYGISYFKDPGDQVCEWRPYFSTTTEISTEGWYKKKVKRCDANHDGIVNNSDDYCKKTTDCESFITIPSCSKQNNTCGGNAECIDGRCYEACILDETDYECTTDNINPKTLGYGGNGRLVVQPEDDVDGNWVGTCPAAQSGCTEYLDPISRFSTNMLFNGDFNLDVDTNGTQDGWQWDNVNLIYVQNIKLENNTLYILAVEGDNQATVSADSNVLRQMVSANNFVAAVASISTINAESADVPRASRIFYTTGGAETADIEVITTSQDSDTKVELKKAIIDYQVRKDIDKESCNGVVDFEEGCVLFNERTWGLGGPVGLDWDADLTYFDGQGAAPSSGLVANGAEVDSNSLIKVSPNRACETWLACRSFIKDQDGKNVCFDVGACNSIDTNGSCNNFVVTDKINQSIDPALAGVSDYANASGYTKVGYKDSSLSNDFYPIGSMTQIGEKAAVPNGSFEFYGENKYPTGWYLSSETDTSWTDNKFSVINNPISAQFEGIKYPIDGQAFLKYSPSASVMESEFIDVEPGTDYVLTAKMNTQNYFPGDDVGDVYVNIEIATYEDNGTATRDLDFSYCVAPDGTMLINPEHTGCVIEFKQGENWQEKSVRFGLGGSTESVKVKIRGVIYGPRRTCSVGNFLYSPKASCTDRGSVEVEPADFGCSDVISLNDIVVNDDTCVGNVYIDNIKLTPALEVKDLTPGPAADESTLNISQSCRLYPDSSSLSCDYYEDSGKRRKGDLGYCLEYDRYPGSSDACLLWYPVDRVKGDWIEDGGGYADKLPVYYCEEAKMLTPIEYRANPGIIYRTGDAGCGDPPAAVLNPPDGYAITTCMGHALCGEGGDGKIYWTPSGDCLVNCDGGDICDGCKISNLKSGWYEYNGFVTIDASSISECSGITSTVHDEASYGLRFLDETTGVIYKDQFAYCSKIVKTVDSVGNNKFWSGRVYRGSDYVTQNQGYTYDFYHSPFASILAPEPLDNPYEWDGVKDIDGDEGTQGYQPLYVFNGGANSLNNVKFPYSFTGLPANGYIGKCEFTDKACFNMTNVTLTGDFTCSGGDGRCLPIDFSVDPQESLKRLFAKSYGTWEWDTAMSRYMPVGGEEWPVPNTPCTGGVRPECSNIPNPACIDYCYVSPLVENMEIDNTILSKNGFVNLTFTSNVNSQQMPLTLIAVLWGDNEATTVSGEEIRSKTNTSDPHSLYHLYSYWDLKAKNSIDKDEDNIVYCGSANQDPENFDGDNTGGDVRCSPNTPCCAIKPSVKIKDNWGKDSGFVSYGEWIVVNEK